MKRMGESKNGGGSTNGDPSPASVPKSKKFKTAGTSRENPLQNGILMHDTTARDAQSRNADIENEYTPSDNEDLTVLDQSLNGHHQPSSSQTAGINRALINNLRDHNPYQKEDKGKGDKSTQQESLYEKLDRLLLKEKDPFSKECDNFFESLCLPLQRPNTEGNLCRDAIRLCVSAKIYLTQACNLIVSVRDVQMYIACNPDIIQNLEKILIRTGHLEEASTSAANPSTSEQAIAKEREVDAESIIEVINEDGNESQNNILVPAQNEETAGASGEDDGSQRLDNTLESVLADRTGYGHESHDFSGNFNSEPSGFPETPDETMNESTNRTTEATEDLVDLMRASSLEENETLRDESETVSNHENMEVEFQEDHVVTSTPLRIERMGPSAGTRQAASNDPLHTRFDLLSLIKGTPTHIFKHRAISKAAQRRHLFENGATLEDATVDADHSLLPLSLNTNNLEQFQPCDVLDFLHCFFRGQIEEPEDITAVLVHIRSLPVTSVTNGHISLPFEEINANGILCFENIGIDLLPPSELFRPTCSRNNSGRTIMERTKEHNKKESRQRRMQLFVDRVKPMLQQCYIKSAIYECSAASLRNVAFFQDKMQNILKGGQIRFDFEQYQKDMLNIANSVDSEEKETESQESGYGSQTQSQLSQHQELLEGGWFTFEQLIPGKDKLPTRQEIARNFCALTKLVSDKCLDFKFNTMDTMPEEPGPRPSTSKNITPHSKARYLNLGSIDVAEAHFKALEKLPRTADRQGDILFPGTTAGRDDDSEAEEEEFVDVEPVQYTGELFSKTSRQSKKNEKKPEGNQ